MPLVWKDIPFVGRVLRYESPTPLVHRWVQKMDGEYLEVIPAPCCQAPCPEPTHDNKGRAEKGLGPAHCSKPQGHTDVHLCGCNNRWSAPVVLDESFED